jgi:dipeptidyl aminopeptidase/acylaminoacyl peptidase
MSATWLLDANRAFAVSAAPFASATQARGQAPRDYPGEGAAADLTILWLNLRNATLAQVHSGPARSRPVISSGGDPALQFRWRVGGPVRVLAAPPTVAANRALPVPASLAAQLEPLLTACSPTPLGWHPDGRTQLVHFKGGCEQPQLHALAPDGNLEKLTDHPSGVFYGSYQPADPPSYLAYETDQHGDERRKIYLKDLQSGQTRPVQGMRSDWRYDFGPWRPDGERALVTAIPMGNYDGRPVTELYELDPQTARLRKLADLPGFRWHPWSFRNGCGRWSLAWSADGRQVAACEAIASNMRGRLMLIDTQTSTLAELLPDRPEQPELYGEPRFAAGNALHLLTNRDSEYIRLARFEHGQLTYLTPDCWDVERFEPSPDGRILAAVANENGRGVLRLYDVYRQQEIDFPRGELPAQSVVSARWSPDGEQLTLFVESAYNPGSIQTLTWRSGEVRQWAQSGELGLGDLPPPYLTHIRSPEGHSISCWVHMPAGHEDGPVPSAIVIHGGPEGESVDGYEAQTAALVMQGYAVLRPNVRGSTGHGRSYQLAANGIHRMRATHDLQTVVEWIRSRPQQFTAFIAALGGSYGGYETYSLAAASEHIGAAAAECGPTNLVSMLERVPVSRADYRRTTYGDERDPAVRKVLDAIAPRNRADRIRCPVLIAQGMNDPRVPYAESDDMAQTLLAAGVPVTYLRFEDEGHLLSGLRHTLYLRSQEIVFLNDARRRAEAANS